METPDEYEEAQTRKFMTYLFYLRAKRHLKTLAEIYGWSPELLQARENQFLIPSMFVPTFQEK